MTQLILPSADHRDVPLIARLGDLWMRHGASAVIHGDRDDPLAMLTDRVRGITGAVAGGAVLSSTCLVKPDAVDDHIEFPSNFGVTNSSGHVVAVLCSVLPGEKVYGAYVKIGDSSTGFGFGVGNNASLDGAGTNPVILEEGVAWKPLTACLLSNGIHLIVFGLGDTHHYVSFGGLPKYAQLNVAKTAPITPSAITYINGYTAGAFNRHVGSTVLAVGIWSGVGANAAVAALAEQLVDQSTSLLKFLNYWKATTQAPSLDRGFPSWLY